MAFDLQNVKAGFRFLRESVGLSRSALAERLGVEPRSVRRWEQMEAPQSPPDDAWELLEDLKDSQDVAIVAGMHKARELWGELPDDALGAQVVLPYWSSQAEYVSYSTDSSLGVASDYELANANVRVMAALLEEDGFSVRIVAGANNPGLIES